MADEQQYKVPEYITMDDALEDDDWGLIINASGELKGIYIPKGFILPESKRPLNRLY